MLFVYNIGITAKDSRNYAQYSIKGTRIPRKLHMQTNCYADFHLIKLYREFEVSVKAELLSCHWRIVFIIFYKNFLSSL